MSTNARNWFATEADFRQCCGDAQSLANDERSEGFAHDMVIAANTTGLETPLSEKQLAWLCRIADRILPTRIV